MLGAVVQVLRVDENGHTLGTMFDYWHNKKRLNVLKVGHNCPLPAYHLRKRRIRDVPGCLLLLQPEFLRNRVVAALVVLLEVAEV